MHSKAFKEEYINLAANIKERCNRKGNIGVLQHVYYPPYKGLSMCLGISPSYTCLVFWRSQVWSQSLLLIFK